MNRITAFMLYNQFSKSMSDNLGSLNTVQQQLSTGKRLTQPSDDVVALRGAMAYKVSINNLEQYDRNVDEGVSMLSLTESSLRSSTNILNRARELALTESNDTSNSDTRDVTAYEVRNLLSQMVDLGNTKLKDKYIYSGYLSKTQAFTSTGTYQGDSNNIEIFIGEGIKSRMNVTGDVAFSDTTKLVTGNLPATMSGNIRITSGSGTPYYLEAGDVFVNATPEAIRDTINAVMSGTYDSTVPDVVGTGTLTLRSGSGSPVDLTINNTNDEPSQIRDAVNALNMGITAGIFQDAAGNERLFFRPTTAGEGFSVDVSDDDGNDNNSIGLSALLHTDIKSNLTSNALGVEALILDDGTNKRMVMEATPANTTFTIDVDEAADGWNGAADIDTTGLSNLYHQSSAVSNLTGNAWNSVTFFSIMEHFDNALSTNNLKGIEASILFMDGALDSVVNTTADVGSRLKYFEDQQVRLEDNGVSFKKSLSILEDADIAASAMELTKIQTTLEAMRIASVI
jgi:flagellar hook-associated protein 3